MTSAVSRSVVIGRLLRGAFGRNAAGPLEDRAHPAGGTVQSRVDGADGDAQRLADGLERQVEVVAQDEDGPVVDDSCAKPRSTWSRS